MSAPTITEFATTVGAVCASIVAVAAAAAVIMRMARWAYAETHRRHRLDRIANLEPMLQKVAKELSPNSGTSLWDRVTHLATEALPELSGRVENVEAYVEELKAREQRGRSEKSLRPYREPANPKEQHP